MTTDDEDRPWGERMGDEVRRATREPRTTGWWPDTWWRRLTSRYPRG